MSQMSKELAAALGNRTRQNLQNDVATTTLGRAAQESSAPQLLLLTQLVSSPYQSRGKQDETYLENLADSISVEGLLDPIIVRPLPEVEGCYTVTPPWPRYELVAGHHRVAAFQILGRTEIPAFVRHLTDAEAARALTSENTVRKTLGEWELYKHMVMLRETGAVPNNTQMARVLNMSRTAVQFLDSFALLPEAVHDLLDDQPDLVGYHLAKNLKPYLPQHGTTVFDALCLLAEGKLSQAAVPAWVADKVNKPTKKPRKEIEMDGGVRLVVTPDGARLSGNLDYDRLEKLIKENLPLLQKVIQGE